MYTTTVRSARITYTKLNRLLFEGKLPPSSQIVFDIGAINKSWAYCEKIKDGVKIKLAPNYKSKHFFITILAHEMVHVWEYLTWGKMTHGPRFFEFKETFQKHGIELIGEAGYDHEDFD